MNLVDFSSAQSSFRHYGGSDAKSSVFYNGDYYLLKKTSRKIKGNNDLATSYPNSIFSEYLGSEIGCSLGLDTHKCVLGKYRDEYVVGCRDFQSGDNKIFEFRDFMLDVYHREDLGSIPTYKQLYETFDKCDKLREIKNQAIERYWDIIVCDGLVGNFDRHGGNWGFLVDDKLGRINLAPVYDFGSCLYARLSEDAMSDVLKSSVEIKKRVFEFPNVSLNKNNDPHSIDKLSYYELFSGQFYDENCIKSFAKIYPKIDLDKINKIIDSVDLLSDVRSDFYKTMIERRKTLLFDNCFEILKNKKLIDDKIINNVGIDDFCDDIDDVSVGFRQYIGGVEITDNMSDEEKSDLLLGEQMSFE